MPRDTAQIGPEYLPDAPRPGPKVRLLTLADLDQRTTAAKRAATLIKRITGDLGGQDRLATGEQQIIQRAAFLGVLAEDVESRWLLGEDIDATVLATIANAQRRLLESVGLKRVPRNVTPSVADYVDGIKEADDE
jgi:hypothetical protein